MELAITERVYWAVLAMLSFLNSGKYTLTTKKSCKSKSTGQEFVV